MNIKWNWGTKLVIAIIIFMSFIFVLVYHSVKNEIFLVEKDYYPKGIKYQDRLDEIENGSPVAASLNAYQEAENVVVSFPEIQTDTGSIYFFRPSDTELDKLYQFSPGKHTSMAFPKEDFRKGKYVIKMFWKDGEKGYYLEKSFRFN